MTNTTQETVEETVNDEGKTETAEVSYLDMSDEEIMAAGPPTAVASTVGAETKPDEVDEVPSNTDDASKAEPTNVAEDSPVGNPSDTVEGEQPTETDKTKSEKEEPEKTNAEPEVVDYKAMYEQILAPFKANGREIKVDSIEDAKALMQMGANYNKKMAAIKPSLKILKMLENNNLLDESRLSFLIDLDKKNPEAISKLVKDSGIDAIDIDATKAEAYKQGNYQVDDREVALDSVLDEIQDTKSFNRTIEIVSKQWDAPSKQIIASSPQLIKTINDHVDRGIYDIINTEIEKEKLFGRLDGLSDLEAYRKVGDAIQARGGFNHLSSSQGKPETKPVIVEPKPKLPVDDKLKDKRKAASVTKPVVAVTSNNDFNPLSMSDEEFSKASSKKFR